MNGYVGLRKWSWLILGSFLIVSAFAPSAGAVTWTHSQTGDYDVWYLNGISQKFRYNLTNQQWSHFSTVGSSWYTISSTGRSSAFIGSGSWYDMGNGFSYQYSSGYDKGTFKDGAVQRFMYKYGPGQWYDSADTLSWQVLGKAGLDAAFVGNGHWNDLGNGFSYWYLAASDRGTFKDGATQRFMYNYASGQWYDSADALSWQTLGNAGLNAAFVGDGHWRDLGNGFTYQYSLGYDKGTFKDGSAYRFLYKYGPGQWYDSADALSWQTLGKAGLNAAFVGNGHWNDLGNGFTYWYLAASDRGTFKDGAAQRFMYNYASGQWYDSADTLSWQTLGTSGLNAGFLGDGHWRDLGNGFTYQYSLGYDKGSFQDGSVGRFQYRYAPGQWWHTADTLSWQTLGADGLSAAFIGSGAWCDLGIWHGNDWWYKYDYEEGAGWWSKDGEGSSRFAFAYDRGQWFHGNSLGWFALGDQGASLAVFIADGSAHNLTWLPGSSPGVSLITWWFRYDYEADMGLWSKDGENTRFSYDYVNQAWYDYAPSGTYQLGGSGLTADFIGNGWHTLNQNSMFYYYRYGANEGIWGSMDVELVLIYTYDSPQWYQNDYGSHYAYGIGPEGLAASVAMWDGNWHNITTGSQTWWYRLYHQFGQHAVGWFARSNDDNQARFAYDYQNWRWSTFAVDRGQLNFPNLRLDVFPGDGGSYDTGGGWNFAYDYANDRATWVHVEYATQFAYDYTEGQWWHTFGGTLYTLGNSENLISNTYYDGNIWSLPIGDQTVNYKFFVGAIDGATREAAYYTDSAGDPMLVYSYVSNGSQDGKWGLFQNGNPTPLWFTESGLYPDVNFADGNYHTTFTGQWAEAKFVSSENMLYFNLSTTTPGNTETIRYSFVDNYWQDQWNYDSSWRTIGDSNGYYYATDLASGNYFTLTMRYGEGTYDYYELNFVFGDSVSNASGYVPSVVGHPMGEYNGYVDFGSGVSGFCWMRSYDYQTGTWYDGSGYNTGHVIGGPDSPPDYLRPTPP